MTEEELARGPRRIHITKYEGVVLAGRRRRGRRSSWRAARGAFISLNMRARSWQGGGGGDGGAAGVRPEDSFHDRVWGCGAGS